MPLPLLTSHRGNHALSGAQQERWDDDRTTYTGTVGIFGLCP